MKNHAMVPVVLPTAPPAAAAPDLQARADVTIARLRDPRVLSPEERAELGRLRENLALDLVSRRSLQAALEARDQLARERQAQSRRELEQKAELERESRKAARVERWRALPRHERVLLVLIERAPRREHREFAEMALALLREGDSFDERDVPEFFEHPRFRLPSVSRGALEP